MSHLGLQLYLPCPCPAQTGALRIKVAFCLGNWTLPFSEANHVIDVYLLAWKDAFEWKKANYETARFHFVIRMYFYKFKHRNVF